MNKIKIVRRLGLISAFISLSCFVMLEIWDDYKPREYVKWDPKTLEIKEKVKASKNKFEANALAADGLVVEENIKFHAMVETQPGWLEVAQTVLNIFASCQGSKNPTPTPAPQPSPTDPSMPAQQKDWGYLKIQGEQANQITKAQDVTVCILDTGIDKTHPDLRHIGGADFTGSGDYQDGFGHGTHVAGIIAALDNNVGTVGISQAQLLIGRVLGSDGSGSLDGIANGIKWCADQGAKVINMSLGGGGPTQLMYQALVYATQKGVKVMASAGNDSGQTNYPAAYQIPGLYAISATDQNDQLTDFSSRGKIELASPGLDIYSTMPMQGCRICGREKGWGHMSGTSMAAPYASGTMALAISKQKQIQADQIGSYQDYGMGRVNALKSVQ